MYVSAFTVPYIDNLNVLMASTENYIGEECLKLRKPLLDDLIDELNK